jgi:hypothetical protein
MNISRLTALLLGLVLSAAMPVLAQTFGVEKRIFPHPVGGAISNNPSVHASGNNIYLVWSHQEGGTASEVYFARSTDNGASFSTPVNISNRAGTDIEPVVTGDGTNVHVFWMDEVAGEPAGSGTNTGAGRIFYARSTNNGASFGAAVAIVDQIGYSRVTSAIVSGSQVHLVFYDNRASGASSVGKVFHKMSCDSGASWNAETNVTQFDGDVDNEQPRILQLTSGDVFIAFRSSRIGVPQGGWPPFHTFILRMSTAGCPGGATWLYPAQRLSSGSETNLGGNYGVNIFPGASGRLHALWWNDTAGTNLQYRTGIPNGAGLGPTTDISEFGLNHLQWEHMTERLGFGLGEDASGRVHAIFQQNSVLRGGFQAGALWYRCAPSAGAAFVAKQLLTGSTVSEPRGVYSNNRLHVIWQDYRHSASPSDQSEIYYNYVDTTACSAPPPTSAPTPSVSTLDFGGNSMQTTSGGTVLTLTNNGAGNLIITDFAATSGFAVAGHTCGTVAPGGNCAVTLTFTPATQGTVNGTLTITYSGGTTNVNLTGVGERSLVTHYYRAILNRAPDGPGKTFWESEAARLTSLGVNINETWFVMAGYFYNSAEYLSYNKNDTQFVTDLYNTFFNRAPDGGGLGYWVGQIQGGLPREVVLFSFMFSTEFRTFTQGIFGNTAARPEVDMVVDFFRGLLNRLPDTPSFNYWLGELRTAQCAGAGPVFTAVDQISAAFMFNPEYDGRGRTNTQFVTDMYYSFLRRGGDVGGVNYWINEINTGARFRNDVRYFGFLNSAEFGARVQAVIDAGCLP